MKIEYVGSADRRVINKADWTSVGLDHDRVVWDSSNRMTAELNKEAGQWLIDNDPKNFKSVEGSPKETTLKKDDTKSAKE